MTTMSEAVGNLIHNALDKALTERDRMRKIAIETAQFIEDRFAGVNEMTVRKAVSFETAEFIFTERR